MTGSASCHLGAESSVLADDGVRTLGVAIAVPDPWGELLQERRASYGDRLAWTIPTHVTLLPPSQVPEARMPKVHEHLATIADGQAPFEIELGGADTFRPVTPTVFLQVAQGGDVCSGLQEQIRGGPLRRKLTFPYHPHVTLAFEVSDDALDRAFADHEDFRLAFIVEGFTRYELGEDGIWLPEFDYRFGWLDQ